MISSPQFKSPIIFLVSEFVVIVFGVLTALGVDEWRNAREQESIRDQLFIALISDLKDDAIDFEQVMYMAQQRSETCQMLLDFDFDQNVPDRHTKTSIGDAFRICGLYARLETNETAFSEMTANGTGMAIRDTGLRIRIMRYYSLARDRADLNTLFQTSTRPYGDQLLLMGYAFSDGEDIDLRLALGNPQLRASIRNILATLPYAIRVTNELVEANQELLQRLTASGSDTD